MKGENARLSVLIMLTHLFWKKLLVVGFLAWQEATRSVSYAVSFYRAMLCIRGTRHGPVSVCLSVCPSVRLSITSRSSTKTTKRRITQTTPHDSPGTLVFWSQRSPRNSIGAKCRWVGHNRRLSQITGYISKTVQDRPRRMASIKVE